MRQLIVYINLDSDLQPGNTALLHSQKHFVVKINDD